MAHYILGTGPPRMLLEAIVGATIKWNAPSPCTPPFLASEATITYGTHRRLAHPLPLLQKPPYHMERTIALHTPFRCFISHRNIWKAPSPCTPPSRCFRNNRNIWNAPSPCTPPSIASLLPGPSVSSISSAWVADVPPK